MATWIAQPLRERPDFRLIITFLWGEFHNVDSDGDATNPASKQWTWLYIQSRANPAQTVEVEVEVAEAPTSFRVAADLSWLAAATAYFLANEFGARVRADEQQGWVDPRALIEHFAHFDREAAIVRARDSVWRKATLANPYPNLNDRT